MFLFSFFSGLYSLSLDLREDFINPKEKHCASLLQDHSTEEYKAEYSKKVNTE